MKFQTKTLALFDAVNNILAEYEGPLTLRQIFYRLVAAHIVENKQSEYGLLSKHLVNARDAALIDWERIIDRTRHSLRVSTWDDLKDFIDAVRQSYRREKWTSQSCNVEVWCEKDAVAGVLQPITDEYEVALFPCRGFDSYSALRQAAEKIKSTSQPTMILYFGDFDPSGKDMLRDLQERSAEWGAHAEFISSIN